MAKFDTETASDSLHSHVQGLIGSPARLHTQEGKMDLAEVANHPNASTDTLKTIYPHIFDSESGKIKNSEALDNMLSHPNFPAALAEDFAKNHNALDPDPTESLTVKASKVKGVSHDVFEKIINDQLGHEASLPKITSLKPEYYLNLLKTNPNHQMWAAKGLAKTSHHTPETINQSVKALCETSNESPNRHHVSPRTEMAKHFIEGRPELSADHLNTLLAATEGSADSEKWNHVAEAVASHKNTEPSLLAKMVNSNSDYYGTVSAAAISNPSLPNETRKALIRKAGDLQDRRILSLASNPATTPEELQSMLDNPNVIHYVKGKILTNDKVPESSIARIWEASDKKTAAAERMLNAANLPTRVLQDLVKHSNQDLAVKALNHPKVNKEVLDVALKRKAPKVSSVARLHPLVAEEEFRRGVLENKTKASDLLNEKTDNVFKKLSSDHKKEIITHLSERYKNVTDPAQLKEDKEDFVQAKTHLALSPFLSEADRNHHARDVINKFAENNPHNQSMAYAWSRESSGGKSGQRAVTKLASGGNRLAQEAILRHPAMLIEGDFSKHEMPAGFSTEMIDKLIEHAPNPPRLMDSGGHHRASNPSEQIVKMMRNPKTPAENILKMANMPHLWQPADAKYRSNMLDEKLADMPQATKDSYYSELLSKDNRGIDSSIVLSSSVSDAHWSTAWNKLSSKEKHDLSDNDSLVKRLPHEETVNAINGAYNLSPEIDPNVSDTNRLQRKALRNLKDNVQSKTIFGNFLANRDALPDYDHRKMETKQLLKTTPNLSDTFKQEDIDNFINSSTDRGSDFVATGLAFKHTQENLNSYPMTPEKITAAYNKVHSYANHGTEGLSPEAAIEKRAKFWTNFFDPDTEGATSSYSGSGRDVLTHLKSKNLDFLADFPGETGKDLAQLAISRNLLSKEKVAAVQLSGALPFTDVFNNATDDTKKEILYNLIDNPSSFTKEHVGPIIGHIRSSTLNGGTDRYRSSLHEDDVPKYTERLQKLSGLISKHPEAALNLKTLFSKVFAIGSTSRRGSGRVTGAPTKEQLKRIIKETVSNIGKDGSLTDVQKSQVNFAIYKALPSGVPHATLLRQVVNHAVKTKDVGTLIDLSKRGDATAAVKAIGDISKNPENLTPEQTVNASALISNPETDLQTSKRIVAALEGKILQADPNSAWTLHAKVNVIAQADSGLMNLSESHDNHADKRDFMVNLVRKHTLDENVNVRKSANAKIGKYINMPTVMPFEERVKAYKNLPSDRAMLDNLPSITSENILNNPEIMESSTEGWKLNNLAQQAHALNFKNTSILTNRLLSRHDLDPSNKDYKSTIQTALRGVVANSSASPSDAVKLARTFQGKELDQTISTLIKDMGKDELLHSNIHAIASERLNQIDADSKDYLSQSANLSATESYQDISKITEGLHAVSTVIRGSKMREDALNLVDKLDSQSESIERIANYTKLTAEMYKKDPSALVAGSPHRANLKTFNSIASNILDSGRQFDRESALHISNIMFHEMNTLKAAGMESKEADIASLTKNITKWVGQSENLKSEDWKSALTANPSMAFGLNYRQTITSDVLDNVDIEKMLDHNPDLAHNEVSKWFAKMDDKSIEKHGLALLKKITTPREGKINDVNSLSTAITGAFPYLKNHLTVEDIVGLASKNSLPNLKPELLKAAVQTGAGGEDAVYAFLSSKDEMSTQNLSVAAKSMYLNEKTSEAFLDKVSKLVVEESKYPIYKDLAGNKFAPPKLIEHVVNVMENADAKNSYEAKETMVALMSNPNISESTFNRLFTASNKNYPKTIGAGSRFHPALANAVHGGRLFRSMPIAIPDALESTVDAKLVAKSATAEPSEKFAKKSQQIQQAVSGIPAEGIVWANFKRQFPALENVPEIKKIFAAKQNKPVVPEDLIKAQQDLEKEMKTKSFHTTYSSWERKLQVHDDKPNLVLQLNNSEESEKELNANPKLWAFYQMLLRDANQVRVDGEEGNIGSHPTTPQLVSWSRIDTSSGEKGWIIEELQSDFAQKFRKNARYILQKSPSGLKVDGHTISPDELKSFLPQIDKAIEGHHSAALNSLIESAKKHGVKKLYIHGSGVRGDMSGGYKVPHPDASSEEKRTVPPFVWFYDEYPASKGFKKVDYSDYPNYSKSRLNNLKNKGLSTHCWEMDLTKA